MGVRTAVKEEAQACKTFRDPAPAGPGLQMLTTEQKSDRAAIARGVGKPLDDLLRTYNRMKTVDARSAAALDGIIARLEAWQRRAGGGE